ncbi:MAG: 50S ribosomal protein L25 [bacterium]
MNLTDLEVEYREELKKNKIKKIRNKEFIPGIIYGNKKESIPIKIKQNIIQKLYRFKKDQNKLLKVIIKGKKESTEEVIANNIEKDSVTNKYIHIDLLRISKEKKINVTVPILIQGTAKGEKKGGILIKKIQSLKIKCLPEQIPETLNIDITDIDLDQFLTVRDIRNKFDFTILNTDSESIIRILSPRVARGDKVEGAEKEDTSTEEGNKTNSNS